MTPAVEKLRDDFGFPGMHILQYAFGGDANNGDLPHNYIRNSVAYTGTHDNDTTAGWYRSASKNERIFCCEYTGSNGRNIHWDLIRTVWASVADTAIVPMQDIFGLGSESRMNTPATASGNWSWRLGDDVFSKDVATKLLDLTEIYGRARS